MKRLVYTIIAILLMSTANAALPKEATKTFDSPFNKVWSAVLQNLAERKYSISTMDKEEGLIQTKRMTDSSDGAHKKFKSWVAGEGSVNAERHEVGVIISPDTVGKTTVKLIVNFEGYSCYYTGAGAKRNNTRRRKCSWDLRESNGEYEYEFMQQIQKKLADNMGKTLKSEKL